MEKRWETENSITENKTLTEQNETQATRTEICDSSGHVLCDIDVDPATNRIISIYPKPYQNVNKLAENLEEIICITDEQGNITDERLTRSEARETKKRYLIVTSLIFHDNKILIQERSQAKKIDPGKESSSAHGVAKELFWNGGNRITDGKIAGLINAALEINEELRHDSNPFTIQVWDGKHDELVKFAQQKDIDDPNKVWLVEEEYLPDDRYPLNIPSKDLRTRAFYAGYIFSNSEPHISVDPSEVESSSWQTTEQLFQNPQASDDLYLSSIPIFRKMLHDHPLTKTAGPKFADNVLDRAMGYTKERTD